MLSTLNRTLKTGNRRFEFERAYLQHGDPWNYSTSAYELDKYARTLAVALTQRRAHGAALEIGCSIGIFSAMLASEFDDVYGVDISREALRKAAARCETTSNVHLEQGDLLSLDLGKQFDMIFCAEVLYYIRRQDAEKACRQLDKHLAADGVVVLVGGLDKGKPNGPVLLDWDSALSRYFERTSEAIFEDPKRSYKIVTYSRRTQAPA